MPTSPVSATPRRTTRARRALVALGSIAIGAGSLLATEPASAQTVVTTVSTGLSIAITIEPPGSSSESKMDMGNLRIFFTITNAGAAATNLQTVIRVGRRPDEIASVSEGSDVRGIGLIDSATGAWYHTIPQIPAGGSTTLVLSMIKVCGGKWPIAIRVGDRLASRFGTWRSTSDSRCAPDETVSPTPASYFQLPWPPTPGAATTTTTASQGATVSTVVSTGGAGGGAANVPPSITGTTLLRLGGPLATTTTTTTTTTIAGKAGVTTTTVILCKTIGGKRYCAPKSSVYKDGQSKSVEVSSKTTKKKTTKKKK